jgi:hypothetical protein
VSCHVNGKEKGAGGKTEDHTEHDLSDDDHRYCGFSHLELNDRRKDERESHGDADPELGRETPAAEKREHHQHDPGPKEDEQKVRHKFCEGINRHNHLNHSA